MIKNIICTECPKGCHVTVELDGESIKSITGNSCEKGEKYAREEVKNARRIITSTVRAEGLSINMVPVRATKPILKEKLFEAMDIIKSTTLAKPVKAGEVIVPDFTEKGIDLVATRDVES